ncbi:MAG: N6-L-threonylcarbamoyladenine synthase [Bradymonadia bacterium]
MLAIETSCDETAAAVVDGTQSVLSSVVHSQIDMHAKFGGVVPEMASRAHVLAIQPIVEQALHEAGASLDDIGALAVTLGPGLKGSLLVGVEFAKAVCCVRGLPMIPVHHIEGHLMAPELQVAEPFVPVRYPFIGLVVSGGHTSLYRVNAPGEIESVGRTLDDAAGEAYDKVGRLLGMPYPAGPIIDRLAANGDPEFIAMPRPMLNKGGADFSFSGIKTFVAQWIEREGHPADERSLADICASFQEAVCETLAAKTVRAARRMEVDHVVVTGGVASNRRLRELIAEHASKRGISVSVPPPSLCTDNAAMIGAAGYARAWEAIQRGLGFAESELDARSSWRLGTSAEMPTRRAGKLSRR